MNEPSSKPKARRLVLSDIKAIARLVATRKMTESDACITLGIKPSQWQVWKTRNKRSELFETIITRTRGAMVDGLVAKIEQAGDDYKIELPNGKVINKRGDWRAPAWLLEKTAPQFAPQQINQTPQVTVQIGIIHEQLKRVIGFSNDDDKTPRMTVGESLSSDSVTIADEETKSLKSNPTQSVAKATIYIPTRKHPADL